MTPPPGSETPEDIVIRDRKDNPGCRYSSSVSKTCSSEKGNRTCETIRRILRSCPGSRSEKIYEDIVREDRRSASANDAAIDGPPVMRGRLYPPDMFSRLPRGSSNPESSSNSSSNSSGSGSGGVGGWAIPFPHPTQQEGAHTYDDIAAEFFSEVFKPFKGIFDDNSTQFPPVPAPPPERDIIRPRVSHPQWRARVGNTTPYCPPPHKGQEEHEDDRTQGSNKWQGGSVVEQA